MLPLSLESNLAIDELMLILLRDHVHGCKKNPHAKSGTFVFNCTLCIRFPSFIVCDALSRLPEEVVAMFLSTCMSILPAPWIFLYSKKNFLDTTNQLVHEKIWKRYTHVRCRSWLLSDALEKQCIKGIYSEIVL